MEINPKKIYEDFKNNNIDRFTAAKLLKSLIENSDITSIRIESLTILEKLNLYTFKFIENLLISDSNTQIRLNAANIIKNNFIEKGLDPMKWVIQYETDIDCLESILDTLVIIDNIESRLILINEIKKIRKEKYLDKSKRINNKKFKRSIKKVLKERKYESFSHEELAQIIINFKIIAALTQKFYSVYYELENALVVKLDLADVEYEVRGWKADFKNNITEISDITGLKYLKQLKYLDISNNLITNVKDLLNVENLSSLLISNNKIADIENLDYFKKMPNLVYLDISDNEFVAKIDKQIENLEVKLRKFYY